MSVSVQIKVNPQLYLRDPQDTKLGKKLIQHSIELINEIGIEDFTFKKLAIRMGSTEASVYRYFVNKHLLLVYLVSWYWEWVDFRIGFNTMNITDPEKQLKIAVKTLVDTIRLTIPAEYVDRDLLHQIVVNEGVKSYHIHQVDEENKLGYFSPYKELNKKISNIIKAINPDFPYPCTLATNMLEMSSNQLYLAEHLPSLTDVKLVDGELDDLEQMLEYFVFKMIK